MVFFTTKRDINTTINTVTKEIKLLALDVTHFECTLYVYNVDLNATRSDNYHGIPLGPSNTQVVFFTTERDINQS